MQNLNTNNNIIEKIKNKSLKVSKSFIAVCLAFTLTPVLNQDIAYARPHGGGHARVTAPKSAPKTAPKTEPKTTPKPSGNKNTNSNKTDNQSAQTKKVGPVKQTEIYPSFYPINNTYNNYCSSNFPWFYYWLLIHDHHAYEENLNKNNDIYVISDMVYNKDASSLFKTVYDITFTNGIKTRDTLERLEERLKSEDEIIYIAVTGTNIGAAVTRDDLENHINDITNTKGRSLKHTM